MFMWFQVPWTVFWILPFWFQFKKEIDLDRVKTIKKGRSACYTPKNQPHPFSKILSFIKVFFSPWKRPQQGDRSLPRSLHATVLNPRTHKLWIVFDSYTCPVTKCLVLWETQTHIGDTVSHLKPILLKIFMTGQFILLMKRNSKEKESAQHKNPNVFLSNNAHFVFHLRWNENCLEN